MLARHSTGQSNPERRAKSCFAESKQLLILTDMVLGKVLMGFYLLVEVANDYFFPGGFSPCSLLTIQFPSELVLKFLEQTSTADD